MSYHHLLFFYLSNTFYKLVNLDEQQSNFLYALQFGGISFIEKLGSFELICIQMEVYNVINFCIFTFLEYCMLNSAKQ